MIKIPPFIHSEHRSVVLHHPKFNFCFSKINRKRSLSSTSPMISTEPSAKKVCVAATNGHYKNDVVMADAVGGAPNGDSKVHQSSPSPSRRGRTARLSSASKTDEENENRREQTPPSRVSARLRSSRK